MSTRRAGRRAASLIVFLACSAGAMLAGQGQAPTPPAPLSVRYHHVHYQVGDPAAAMRFVAARVDGTREILRGLGVGVRSGSQFWLFDRAGASDVPTPPARSVTEAVVATASWFESLGVTVVPADATTLRLTETLDTVPWDHIGFAATDLSAVVERLGTRGVRPIRQTAESVLFDADSVRVEVVRDTDRPDTFWCPMHADVRGPDPTTCPICGMPLVPIPPLRVGEYGFDVALVRAPGADGATGLRLKMIEPGTNTVVRQFTEVHERLLHLFVISRDLESFAHVHPELQPDGTFLLEHALAPGEYMLIADFLPTGGTAQMPQKAVIVPGRASGARAGASAPASDLRITMEAEGLAGARRAELTFTVADATTGEPVTDLEPFLGAAAHMLIVRTDLRDAVHAHPDSAPSSGPTIVFDPLMPAAGEYRAWIQVQRHGVVSTASFDLSVPLF